MRYCADFNAWYLWNGNVWVRADPHVRFRARQLKATTGEVKGSVALMMGEKGLIRIGKDDA